jgi:hypothetical protein
MISQEEYGSIDRPIEIGADGEIAKLRLFRKVHGSKTDSLVSLHSGRVGGLTRVVVGLHRSAIPEGCSASFEVTEDGRSRLYFLLSIDALVELYSLMGDYIESMSRSEFGLD